MSPIKTIRPSLAVDKVKAATPLQAMCFSRAMNHLLFILVMSGLLLGGCGTSREQPIPFRSLEQLVDVLNESVRHNDSTAYIGCFDVSASVSPLLGDVEARDYRYEKTGRKLEERLARDFREFYFLEQNDRQEAGIFRVSKREGDSFAIVTYSVSLTSNGAEITSIKAHLTNTGWHLLLDDEWCRKALGELAVGVQ